MWRDVIKACCLDIFHTFFCYMWASASNDPLADLMVITLVSVVLVSIANERMNK